MVDYFYVTLYKWISNINRLPAALILTHMNMNYF